MSRLICPPRLLGTMQLSLQEVVSRGSQTVSSILKSKKGEAMQVRDPMPCHRLVVLCGNKPVCSGPCSE